MKLNAECSNRTFKRSGVRWISDRGPILLSFCFIAMTMIIVFQTKKPKNIMAWVNNYHLTEQFSRRRKRAYGKR